MLRAQAPTRQGLDAIEGRPETAAAPAGVELPPRPHLLSRKCSALVAKHSTDSMQRDASRARFRGEHHDGRKNPRFSRSRNIRNIVSTFSSVSSSYLVRHSGSSSMASRTGISFSPGRQIISARRCCFARRLRGIDDLPHCRSATFRRRNHVTDVTEPARAAEVTLVTPFPPILLLGLRSGHWAVALRPPSRTAWTSCARLASERQPYRPWPRTTPTARAR